MLSYTRAEQARRDDNTAEARRCLREALNRDPSFPAANARLGDILVSEGFVHEGWLYQRKAAQMVASRTLTNRESYRILGMFLYDSNQNEAALKIYEEWAAEFPRDYFPVLYSSSVCRRVGRSEEARDLLKRAERLAPGNVHVTLHRAQLHMDQGELAEARVLLDRVRGSNAWWWRYQAEYHFLSGRLDLAWEAFHYFGLQPGGDPVKQQILEAFLLAEAGIADAARARIERLLARPPGTYRSRVLEGELWRMLSALQADTGDRSLAIESAGKAAQTEPENLITVLNAAILLFQLGAVPEGQQWLARSRPKLPDSPTFHSLLLRVEAHRALARGQAEEAVRSFKRSGQTLSVLEPQEGRAEALKAAGEAENARQFLEPLALRPGAMWLAPERYRPALHRRALLALGQDSRAQARLAALNAAAPALRKTGGKLNTALCPNRSPCTIGRKHGLWGPARRHRRSPNVPLMLQQPPFPV